MRLHRGGKTAPPFRPIITLTSDFGLADAYVAAMKAAVLQHCRDAHLIDVTHLIPPQDILAGSIALERAVAAFPPGTIHLAVVDPGVGTSRRILVVRVREQWVVCPDNGLITWAWRRQGRKTGKGGQKGQVGGKAYELTWRPGRGVDTSSTFHGRDIMAPAVGKLACGEPLLSLARPMRTPVLLAVSPASPRATHGRVIHIDHFGNATTNLPAEALKRGIRSVRVGDHSLGKLRRTYHDVLPGQPLALAGSSGLLEIAVRNGSAAMQLRLHVGDAVRLDRGR